ncbi:MAG: ATP-binding cassette domain-containing protein [Chlamydiia bacterium]|nr:ATP-binding cassette domain-containing protein [Chlamydiia bacterium]
MDRTECGAVCLQIILSYWRHFVPLEALRYSCGVSRDGSTVYNLAEAAKREGMEVEAFECTAEELTQIPTPAILHWNHSHFVVLEKIRRGNVWINNPASGRQKILWNQFTEHFTNVVLVMQPDQGFVKQKERGPLWTVFSQYGRQFASVILFLVLSQWMLVFFGLFPPALTRMYLDVVIVEQVLSWVFPIVLFLSGLFVVVGLIAGIYREVLKRFTVAVNRISATQFLSHLIQLPLLFYLQRFPGELINRIKLNTTLMLTLLSQTASVVLNLCFVFIYGIVLVSYDVTIACVGIGAAVLNLFVLFGFQSIRKNAYARFVQQDIRFQGMLIDALEGLETVKSMGRESAFFHQILDLSVGKINAHQNLGVKEIWFQTLTQFFQGCASLLLIGLGALQIMAGELTVGLLMGFQLLLSSFIAPLNQLIGVGVTWQKMAIDKQKIDDVLAQPIDPLLERDKERKIFPQGGEVVVDRVTFGYAPFDDPLLEEVSFSLPAGVRVALLGETGSGKTTLAYLLCGLYLPWTGGVRCGGVAVQAIERSLFPKVVGQVTQKYSLFEGTLRENLTFFDRSQREDALLDALEVVGLAEELQGRGNLLDLPLIVGGKNLSEGQRQRVEIARALIHRPKLLILDEATSALDRKTEQRVLEQLEALPSTLVFISHRPYLTERCERKLSLKEGRVEWI